MIPAAHLLSDPRRFGHRYTARCACGLDVYGPDLPGLWANHQRHLDATRAASQSNHPSRRNP